MIEYYTVAVMIFTVIVVVTEENAVAAAAAAADVTDEMTLTMAMIHFTTPKFTIDPQ